MTIVQDLAHYTGQNLISRFMQIYFLGLQSNTKASLVRALSSTGLRMSAKNNELRFFSRIESNGAVSRGNEPVK